MSVVDFGKKLLECAKRGETEEVRLLMSNGAPFTTDWLGTSPLHMAAEYGHVSTAEVLLRAGISRDARTKVDRTPLHVAAQEGHIGVVELLIRHGADVNAQDMLQMTPMHWAVERDHIRIIMCLLEHDVDLTVRSKFNKTPLDIAADSGKLAILKLLQDHLETAPVRSKVKKTTDGSLQKAPLLLPRPGNLPFKVIKNDAVPSSCAKEVNIKNTVKTLSSVTTNNNFIGNTGNTKASLLPHPVLLKTNFSRNNKDMKSSFFSDSDEGEMSEQSCTSVLATLAALAEATAPDSSRSTQETLQWLERQGITMPSDNTTIVASALEGGQTVSLTEAGKLALTWVKEQKQFSGGSCEVDSSTTQKDSTVFCSIQSKTLSPSKLIKVVANKSTPSPVISRPQPIFVVNTQDLGSTAKKEQPPAKKLKPDEVKLKVGSFIGKPNITTVSSMKNIPEDEKLILQKELEKIRKEAAEYKARLLLKEHEAEEYRKQLEELKNTSVNL